MIKEQVSPELAAKEIEGWLDAKKVSSKKRELYKDMTETLVGAVADGTIAISDDNKIIHTLLFPENLGDFVGNGTLEYKPRLTLEAVQSRMKGTKSGDGDARIQATIAALTDKPMQLISKLDSEDVSIAQAVAVFFL